MQLAEKLGGIGGVGGWHNVSFNKSFVKEMDYGVTSRLAAGHFADEIFSSKKLSNAAGMSRLLGGQSPTLLNSLSSQKLEAMNLVTDRVNLIGGHHSVVCNRRLYS